MARKYWWVNQTVGFESEIAGGRLWTAPNARGEVHVGRRLIHDLVPGDLVFHYSNQAVRALSTVAEPAAPLPRPDVYKLGREEPEMGWVVSLDVLDTEILVPGPKVAESLARRTATLDKNGQPNRRYLSELSESDARKLFRAAGRTMPDEESIIGRPISELLDPLDPTDGVRWGKYRAEQRLLRSLLLSGKTDAPCDLCGHRLPARLLIAAHIKPRRDCTEEERRDFGNVAMLLCALGCDALFEWGYIRVDQRGVIRRGAKSSNSHLASRVGEIIGRRCGKHSAATAAYFAARALGTESRD